MHAYIIVGRGTGVKKTIDELIDKNSAYPFPFELSKIADVRSLVEFTKLAQSKKTAIIIEFIDSASEEAQNALLKNLEEPPDNLLYILTATNEDSVLSTILSRCSVIYVENNNKVTNQYDFLSLAIGERLLLISKIQKREEAKSLLETIICESHTKLRKNPKIAPLVKEAIETLARIEQNGNVHLHLTNFVAATDSIRIEDR